MAAIRVGLAVVVAGLIYFVWGNISWMVLTWHDATLRSPANEAALVEGLRGQLLESGVYIFPGMTGWEALEADERSEAWSLFVKRHEQGPIGMIVYHAEGRPPMPPALLARGFGMNLLSAAVLAAVMILAGRVGCGFLARASLGLAVAFFATLNGHLALWNWMHYPLDYSLVMAADVLIGWGLASLAMAAILQPRPAIPRAL